MSAAHAECVRFVFASTLREGARRARATRTALAIILGAACCVGLANLSATADDLPPLPAPSQDGSDSGRAAGRSSVTDVPSESTPIDLASALRLGGVRNLQLVVAQQRVEVAVAVQQLTAAQILPRLSVGASYDNHTGVLQQDNGNILSVDRSALFGGAGAGAVGGSSVQIPGVFYDVNLSQAIYDYLTARQVADQRRFDRAAVDNAVLLAVATAYTDLLRTTSAASLAILVRNDAREIARLTGAYAKRGEGRQADADRAATELARRDQDVFQAEGDLGQARHRLCELLNLDATLRLVPLESQVVPEAIVPTRIPLPELLAIAALQRPELQAQRAAIRAALLQLHAAKVLAFSPTVLAGFSGGVFGGGSNNAPSVGESEFGNFGGRTDLDVVLYWSLQNLGLGNKAIIDVARARWSRTQLEELAVLDRVRNEVAAAFFRSQQQFAQISRQVQAVRSGTSALQEDMIRVRGRQGLPIELLDSLRQVATARTDYLATIIGFNQAEFQLYVALGSPPADALSRAVPKELMNPPAHTLEPK